MDGRKDILGVWIGENESSKFWLNVLNDLKNRGAKDVYVTLRKMLYLASQKIVEHWTVSYRN